MSNYGPVAPALWAYVAPEISFVHSAPLIRAEDEPSAPPSPSPGSAPIPAAPPDGTAAAAQAQLETTAKPPSVLGEAAKPAEAEPPAEPPPPFDPAKIQWPEGAKPDEKLLESFSSIAKDHGLTHEVAEKLVGLHAEFAQRYAEQSVALWNKTREGWVNEVRGDKEVGGDHFQGMLQTVAKVLGDPQFADPAVKQALDETGAGDHPAIVRTFYRMAKALTEGRAVQGQPPSAKPAKTAAERLFPNNPVAS